MEGAIILGRLLCRLGWHHLGSVVHMKCPKCGSEMEPLDHLLVRWICLKCGHEEKVKPDG